MQSIIVKFSPAQIDTIAALMAATDSNRTEVIRAALELLATQHDITFPQDVRRRGEWSKTKK